MATTKMQVVSSGESETKQKREATVSSVPVRIAQKTKVKLELLLKQANKDRIGRKVKTDDLVIFSLGLITDEHLAELCNRTLSNKDRMELLFRKVSKEKRGMSRDEFFGMLLDGKVAN